MFGLRIYGDNYVGEFASVNGMLTTDIQDAMKFQNRYWVDNLAYYWNKQDDLSKYDTQWIPVEFTDDGVVDLEIHK